MPPRQTHSAHRDRGFALLITITLLAFLVLLLVSLASLTRVETQVASNSQHLAQARQNALFALNVAIGQLQKAAGPDQRVTARADVTGSTVQNPLWTGVWGRTSAPDAYLTATNPATATTGATLNWLISGNEGISFTADAAGTVTPPTTIPILPAAVITNLQGSNALATNITIASTAGARASVLLVGEKTARPSDTTRPATAYVAAPLVDINTAASNLPGFSSTNTTQTRIGRYAWWVGDEGVKARGNMSGSVSSAATATIADKVNQVRLAQRAAIELLDDDTTSANALKLPGVLDAQLDRMDRWINPSQLLALADGSANATILGDASRLRYHDYSTTAFGVQSDVNKGGLKMDLSTAFEMTDAAFDASDLGAAGTDRVAVRGITPAKYTTFTYTRDLGADAGDTSAPAGETLKLRGPTWHALRNHYRLYTGRNLENSALPFAATAAVPNASNSGIGQNNHVAAHFNAGTTLDSNTHDYTTRPSSTSNAVTRMISAGVAPYINRITLAYGLRTEPVGQSTEDGKPIYRVMVVVTPFVVLHNPYNAPIELKDLDADGVVARIHTGSMPFRIRVRANGYSFMPEDNGKLGRPIEPYSPNPAADPTYPSTTGGGMFEYYCISQAGRAAFNDGANSFRFELPPITIPAGGLQIFSPEKTSTGNGLTEIGTAFLKLKANATYDGGFYLSRLNGVGYTGIWYMGANPIPAVLCPTGAGGAATAGPWQPPLVAVPGPADANNKGKVSDIWVPGDMPVTLEINPDDWGFYYRYRYVMESAGSADTTSTANINSVSFLTDLQTRMVAATASPNTAQNNFRAYSNYTSADFNKRRGGQSASAYAGQTVYLYAMDVYTKPADTPAAKVARPFITSNPMALVQNYNALGENNGYNKTTAGYPTVMPQLQVEHIDLNNGSTPLSSLVPHDPDTGGAFWGSTKQASGQSTVKLIEIPSRPMTSLAEFQHANLSLYGYQPYFTAGNSYALPHIPTDKPTYNAIFSSGRAWTLYDSSFFLNESLWDSSFFSSLSPAYSGAGKFGQTPATRIESVVTNWQAGTAKLPNQRITPYVSSSTTGSVPLVSGGVLSTKAHRIAAASMLTKGSFNINSRSVDAWTALLAGARKAGMVSNDAGAIEDLGDDVAIPRLTPNDTTRNTDPTSANTWKGFARLTPADIRTLAERIVSEISTRQSLNNGRPFLTLAEFINRALRNDTITNTGYSGALQAALDATANSSFNIGNAPTQQMETAQSDSRWTFRAPKNGRGPASSTALGFLLQADVLQQIGPQLSARSDTFTIRTYGESIDAINSTSTTPVIQGRAWLEAVVQRVPDFVDQTDPALTTSTLGSATPLASLNATNTTFGRRFKVVSFRWLTTNDI